MDFMELPSSQEGSELEFAVPKAQGSTFCHQSHAGTEHAGGTVWSPSSSFSNSHLFTDICPFCPPGKGAVSSITAF